MHGRKNYEEQLKNMLVVHGRNLDIIPLTTQLESLNVNFSSNSHDKHSMKDITETLKTISVISKEYFFQIIIVPKILLVIVAANAVSERSALNLRSIKDWLCTSITQKRLNQCVILSVHIERADNLDLVANDFCSGKEERWDTFGNF